MAKEVKRNEVLYQMINQRIAQELQRRSDLDAKASNLFGIASAITGFLLGSLNFGLGSIRLLPLWHIAIYLLGNLALVISIVFCLFAVRVKVWTMVPGAKALVTGYKDEDVDVIYARVGATMAEYEGEFITQNNAKAKNIRIAWYSTLVGLGLVFLYAVLLFVGH